MLSRISWPAFPTEDVLNGISKTVRNDEMKRVCIQALNYPEVFRHLLALVEAINRQAHVPISISCQPLKSENLKQLVEAGVERIGIPLDAATEELFDKTKGVCVGSAYVWKNQFNLLSEAVDIFGKGRVSTHLIVGLGETERQMVYVIQRCVNIGVLLALFAFTPIPGTALERNVQPPIQTYRRIQIARFLIVNGIVRCEDMSFDDKDRIISLGVSEQVLLQTIRTMKPFLTSGCPSCNRPYYNEKPSGPIYNFPRGLTDEEGFEIQKQVELMWPLQQEQSKNLSAG